MATQPATNAREVFELLRDDLAAIEREFGRDTVSSVRVITEIGEYLRAGGGKRIRPALLLLSSRLFGNGHRGAIQLGAVVEIIHTATLVHDDAERRTGRAISVTISSSGTHAGTGSPQFLALNGLMKFERVTPITLTAESVKTKGFSALVDHLL